MSAQAQIADRRFQRYEGKRLGVGYSFLRLVLHSIGWVLGLKRTSRYKIVPNLALVSVFVPASGFVIGVALSPPGTPPPPYYSFYYFTLPAIYIFVALTMPELICPDRRHGTLRMYVTSNLNPAVYVAAKVLAAWSVLALVTVVPVIILLVTYSLLGHGPASVGDWFKTPAQILGAGLVLAIFYGTIALAISSLTDRNSFASAGIILTFVLSGAALGILQGPLKAPAWVLLVNMNQLPAEFVARIYQLNDFGMGAAKVPTWEVAAAAAAWVLVGLAVLAYRYRGEGRK
ncbi:MAG TPA: ABC transporter permease [Candidatus Dormibacteraeota bacterium]|nr:ABC transporter permease [Candidatus Dormibacteraeota bacterium]